MDNIYLGRQPVVNVDEVICAYEILYKDAEQKSKIDSERHASASVINSVLNKFGTRSILGARKAFVKIDEKFLMSDLILSIPKEFFIFALLESIEMNERVVERVQQLYEKEYILAIDDLVLRQSIYDKYEVIFKELSYVKIKIDNSSEQDIKKLVPQIQKHDIKVVATRIDTQDQFRLAKEFLCDCFEGYFFAKPKILENAKYEPQQANVLKLYNLLMQDTNIDEITSEFEKNHEITLQLLQFINSGAFHFRNRISSIHHVLTLVGRIPLGQWLMLMIYSKSLSKSGQRPALMLMVRNRTELMQKILKSIYPDVKSNTLGEAYFVGVLSLIDTVFGRKLEDVLKDMNVSQNVEEALLEHKGVLGEIFVLVKDIESFNTRAAEDFETKYELEQGTIDIVALESMVEVQEFENPTPQD